MICSAACTKRKRGTISSIWTLPARAAARAGLSVDARIAAFAAREAQLITDPDPLFRFHSGPPQQAAGALQARGSD